MSESFQKIQVIINNINNSVENLNLNKEYENKIEKANKKLTLADNSSLNKYIIAPLEDKFESSQHEQIDKYNDTVIMDLNDALPNVLVMSNYVINENFIVDPNLQQEVAQKIVQGHPLNTPPYFTTNDHEDDLMLVPIESNFLKDLSSTLESHPSLIEQPFEKDLYLYHFATMVGMPAVLAYLIQAWDHQGLLNQFLALPKPVAWRPIQLNNLFLHAVRANDAKQAELYLRAGADHEAISTSYNRAVHLAAKRGHLTLIKLLVEKKANLNLITEESPWSALHWAVAEGQIEVIDYLLQQGVNIDIRDQTGKTPIFWLLANQKINQIKQKDCLIKLIELDAFILAQDEHGDTPLHELIKISHKIIPTLLMHLLLAAGADIHLKNKAGKTPLDYAEAKHPFFKETLLRQSSLLKKLQCFNNVKEAYSQLEDTTAFYFTLPQKLKETEQLLEPPECCDDFEIIENQAEENSWQKHFLNFKL